MINKILSSQKIHFWDHDICVLDYVLEEHYG